MFRVAHIAPGSDREIIEHVVDSDTGSVRELFERQGHEVVSVHLRDNVHRVSSLYLPQAELEEACCCECCLPMSFKVEIGPAEPAMRRDKEPEMDATNES